MNALTLTLIRLAFLAVLWLFVIAAVGVVRTDLFGPAISGRQQRRQQKAQRGRAQQAADMVGAERRFLWPRRGRRRSFGQAIGHLRRAGVDAAHR